MGGNLNLELTARTCGKNFTKESKNFPSLLPKSNVSPLDTLKAIKSFNKSFGDGNCSTFFRNSKEWALRWCLILKILSHNSPLTSKYLITKMEKSVRPTLNTLSYHLGCLMIHCFAVQSFVPDKECQYSHTPMNTKKENLAVFSDPVNANQVYKTIDRLMMSSC